MRDDRCGEVIWPVRDVYTQYDVPSNMHEIKSDRRHMHVFSQCTVYVLYHSSRLLSSGSCMVDSNSMYHPSVCHAGVV